jgi:hypothetical protein
MGQQPNLELDISVLPRPESTTPPARSWKPGRPGELNGPGDVPRGGLYGNPGPDPGYAARLVAGREFPLAVNEHRADTAAALRALVGARASRLGRAPLRGDVDAAMAMLGLDPEGLPDEVLVALEVLRVTRFGGFAHDPERVQTFLAGVPEDLLVADLATIRRRTAAGDGLARR